MHFLDLFLKQLSFYKQLYKLSSLNTWKSSFYMKDIIIVK